MRVLLFLVEQKIFSNFKPIDIFIIRMRGLDLVFYKIDKIQKMEIGFTSWTRIGLCYSSGPPGSKQKK